MKKQNEKAFSMAEIIAAVAIFFVAALSLTASVMNGLLCRSSLEKHNSDAIKYALISHMVKSTKSISDATRPSHLTLPNGKKVQTNIAVTGTDLESLFSVDMTIGKNRYTTFVANKNWR
jgi:hypothetical protein